MNVIVIEDEKLAADRLAGLIQDYDASIKILAQLDSVEETIEFFHSRPTVDLLFLDIQLSDGKSFEIFDRVQITTPIIFTTAYDQYALQAFKHYSIDYLLKPVQYTDLQAALQKFKNISQQKEEFLTEGNLAALKKIFHQSVPSYKQRLLVKAGHRLLFKSVKDVSYFFADGKDAYVVVKGENRKQLIDYTLEELDGQLDPKQFFRISRKFILNINSIVEVKGLISRKLEVRLNQPTDHLLTVSRERAQEFRDWLDC